MAKVILDPIGEASRSLDPLGEPHVELIDRDHSDAIRGSCDEPAEREGPGRVAVHAQQGQRRILHLIVEEVPHPPDSSEVWR